MAAFREDKNLKFQVQEFGAVTLTHVSDTEQICGFAVYSVEDVDI